jgi:exodeoxyribonuclease VIII
MSDNYFNINALSNSFLIAFDRSPKHAFTEKETTKAMEIGTALHSYILEPEKFKRDYFIMPIEIKNRKNKPYPEMAKEVPESQEILLYEELQSFWEIKENLDNLLIGKSENFEGISFIDFLNQAEKEKTIEWSETFFDLEIKRKARIDLVKEFSNLNIVIDLKSTTDCSKFDRKVNDFQLYRQAETYSRGYTILTGKPTLFYFIDFETKEPFGCMIHELDEDYLFLGEIKNRQSIENYVKWVQSGSDKNQIYSNQTKKIYKPKWLN